MASTTGRTPIHSTEQAPQVEMPGVRPGVVAGPVSRRAAVLRACGILAVIAIWLGIASVGGPAIGSLTSLQSNDQEAFLPAGAESVRAANAAKPFSRTNSLPAFLLLSTTSGKATPDQLTAWQSVAASLPGTPIPNKDEAGANWGTLSDYLGPQPLTLIPAGDGEAGLVLIPLDSAKVTKRDAAGKSPLPSVVETIKTTAAAGAAGGQAHIAGPAALIADFGTAFGGIDGLLLVVALGAVLIILFLVYRAIALPFVVLFTSIFGLTLAGGVVYLLADNDVIKLNGQSQGILSILVVGAATDYGLLLVARYREELQRTASKYTAMRRAWRACVAPIAASAGTVMIGLLCLLLSDLNSNKSLGPVGAVGIAAALVAALTLLPALLMGGRWLFWPRVPHAPGVGKHDSLVAPIQATDLVDPGSVAGEHKHRADATLPETPGRVGIWTRIASLVGRHPRRLWVLTAIVLGVVCLAVPTLKASGTAQTDVFLTKVDSIAGQEQLVKHFPGGSGSPVVIVAPQGSLPDVVAKLGNVGGLAPNPLVVSALPGGQGEPLVVDGKVQVQATLTAAADSPEAKRVVGDVRSALHSLPGGDQILVGGGTATQIDTLTNSKHDLRVIIPAILLAVLLVLIVLLRSLVAPLLVVAATVLSFGTALGVAALMFNHVFDFPGSDPAVPLFSFVFLVALGVDYSIFLMTRAREEVAVHGPKEGVLRALTVTGGVITSAGVVLATTFAALAVIPILFLAQIAFVVAFGVLLDTLVVRTLLVPALAYDLGKWTWWPGKPRPSKHQLELLAERELVDAGEPRA